MISQARLEAICREALAHGKNADQVAKTTGIPQERVQRMMHQIRGRDPDEASRETARSKWQENRRLFGGSGNLPTYRRGLPGGPGRGRDAGTRHRGG